MQKRNNSRRSHFFYLGSLLFCVVAILSCSKKVINLTPDVILEYGLDQITLPNVQLYYRAITIRSDSTITHDEPTVFRRIAAGDVKITETNSLAAQPHLDKQDIILLRDGTPCRIVEILENGRVLRANFGNVDLDFALSYKSGYNFELVSDTVSFSGRTYVRSQVPLIRSIGILSVDRRKLEKLNDSEIRIQGNRIDTK